jgi:hypothetical protein
VFEDDGDMATPLLPRQSRASRLSNRCDGCGQAGADLGPMLRDHIWRQIAQPGEHTLCAKCMASAPLSGLGACRRSPTCGRAPWNLFHRPHSWFDLFTQMEGPPQNLAEWQAAIADMER